MISKSRKENLRIITSVITICFNYYPKTGELDKTRETNYLRVSKSRSLEL